jgi:hypothetical protein
VEEKREEKRNTNISEQKKVEGKREEKENTNKSDVLDS